VNYPLPVKLGGRRVRLRHASDFRKHYADIMTVRVTKAIVEPSVETLFCKDTGIMFGDGEVWVAPFTPRHGAPKILIISINN
jgi:hypothetical protein